MRNSPFMTSADGERCFPFRMSEEFLHIDDVEGDPLLFAHAAEASALDEALSPVEPKALIVEGGDAGQDGGDAFSPGFLAEVGQNHRSHAPADPFRPDKIRQLRSVGKNRKRVIGVKQSEADHMTLWVSCRNGGESLAPVHDHVERFAGHRMIRESGETRLDIMIEDVEELLSVFHGNGRQPEVHARSGQGA